MKNSIKPVDSILEDIKDQYIDLIKNAAKSLNGMSSLAKILGHKNDLAICESITRRSVSELREIVLKMQEKGL